MKNVLFLLIDSLSQWYIEKLQKTDFFKKLKNNSYYFSNLYSGAPFTQGAYKTLIYGEDNLQGYGYLSELYNENISIYEAFKRQGYLFYRSKLFSFDNDKISFDNNVDIEDRASQGFEELWMTRIRYYRDLFQKGVFKESEYWKLEFLLDNFFECYHTQFLNEEKKSYEQDKKIYILEILEKGENSAFYQAVDLKFLKPFEYPEIEKAKMLIRNEPTVDECKFAVKAKYKNIEILFENNKDCPLVEIEKALLRSDNASVQMNNDLIAQLRNSYKYFPKMRDELKDFIEWYDHRKTENPFLAVLTMYDFHYPDNFINVSSNSRINYEKELKQKNLELEQIENTEMSVSNQLSFRNIERLLCDFWEKLEKRHVFDDTYVVLTADHGLLNTMRLCEGDYWTYTNRNFHIPFYIQGGGIETACDEKFRNQAFVHDFLLNKCGITAGMSSLPEWRRQYDNGEIAFTYWINMVPDLDRVPVKLGIRNHKYSITYENYISAFFESGKLVAIYNLEEDKDERVNLAGVEPAKEGYRKLRNTLRDVWFDFVVSILTDKKSPYGFCQQFYFLDTEKTLWQERNRNTIQMTWKRFEELYSGRKIIIFGTGAGAERLLSDQRFKTGIEELWDNNLPSGSKYKFAHRVFKPHILENQDEYVVIISGRYEMEMLHQLDELGITHVLFYRMVQ